MKKIHMKLMAIALALVIAVAMVILSSYAWFVLSSSPSADGMQVTIGGSNTILVAPDMTEEVDGEVYHYPGGFKNTLNLNQVSTYSYLSDLIGLTPVSTADGINWFLPEFYEFNDPEVLDGTAVSGTLKDISEFTLDDRLVHANLTKEEHILAEKGSYVYLDFWVVSPIEDCYLRVSTDTSENSAQGSYVIGMPEYQLDGRYPAMYVSNSSMPAAIRVGFLANPDTIIDDTMLHYQKAASYSEQYTRLCGEYTEKDGYMVFSNDMKFTIYEPNADHHPEDGTAKEGVYVITSPIGLENDVPAAQDIRDRLTVQKTNTWKKGTDYDLNERFKVFAAGQQLTEENLAEMRDKFYANYLQYQFGSYISKGAFIQNTSAIYGNKKDDIVDREKLDGLLSAGATDDTYIVKLDRNVPQKIRMFVWLEGQDIDCTQAAAEASAAISIELAGSRGE